MKKSSLCPGFRFHPTDVELVMYYLKRKLLGKKMVPEVIAEVNIYDFSPWDLPDKSSLRNGDLEWFFYCPKSKKYPNGSRMNRATEAGYWKASGKDREVKYKERTVAMIKTLIFHMGHPPKGTRTDWVMHEYSMEDKNLANEGVVQEAYALCRLFEKSGAGPKNGAQYGAPFEEEEWVDEDDESGLSGAATEIVNPIGTSPTYTNMTFYVPGPSTATSSENMTHMDTFTVTSSEALSVSGATKTLTSYASGSASAMTDPSLAEPDPAAITISEVKRYLDKSNVTSSAVFGLSGASEVPVPYARDLTVINMTSTEPGPFTITSITNERNHVPAKNDAMPTSEHIASIFHDNNTLEVENRNGKNLVADAPNEDDVTVLDSAALSTLDDLSLDGFHMFYDDGSTNFMMEAFLLDNLDDDLGNFF